MREKNTTRVTIDLDNPPDGGTDWERLERMTEEDIHAAAESDPDCPPSTPEQLARMRRVPSARRARENCGMTQVEFARAFRLSVGTVRDWEQHRYVPDSAARALLCIIERHPAEAQDAMLPAWRAAGDVEGSRKDETGAAGHRNGQRADLAGE